MQKSEKRAPEVRFKGFVDAWEQCKFSDIANVVDGDRGKNYPSSDDFSEQGHTLFLSATNVTKDGFSFESNQYITEEKSNVLGNGKLKLNDIVLTSRGSLGHVAWYNNDIESSVPFARINSGMLILRFKEDLEPSYTAQYLKSPLGKRQIDLISFGSAQPQLTKKDVSNYKIPIPEKAEQVKLGVFLKQIDDTIALLQRKLDKLKQLKKGFLQQMFPQNGGNIPQLRFANFDVEWEQRKLGEVTERLKSYSLSRDTETANDTGFKYVHYGDIHTKVANIINESSELPNIKAGNYESLQKGDLVLADASEDYQGIAIPAVVTIKPSYKLIAGLHTIALRPVQLESLFLYYMFHSTTFRKYGYRIGTGMKVFGISVSNVLKFPCVFPVNEEQKKISRFLKQLDDAIALLQTKRNKLQTLKKVLLQKMFV